MTDFTREEVIDIAHKLVGADLSGLDLSGANLRGADLRDADLSGARLSSAKYNANTQWPAGFDPVAAGAEMVEDDD